MNYLEDKMTRAIAILPQLEGQKGDSCTWKIFPVIQRL